MMPNQNRNTVTYAALLMALAVSHTCAVEANLYNRMQSSASSTFNPLARMVFRGGETRASSAPGPVSLKPTSSSSTSHVPRIPTSTAATSIPNSAIKPKKKRRKKTSAASGAIPKVIKAPLAPPPAPIAAAKKAAPAPIAPIVPPVPTDEAAAATTPESKSKQSQHDKMPSIFTKDGEKHYDTYAACLAATESLRRVRDSKIKNKKGTAAASDDKSFQSWKSMLKSNIGGAGSASSESGIKNEPSGKEEFKRACAEYVLDSSKAINALGLSVTQFNQLGREVYKNKDLKEKVMEQAYLYRMASTIKMDKIPLIQDPDSKQLLKSTRRRRVQMFVRSITEIEELREEQTTRLRKALNIDKLPSNVNLCDPNVMPLLSSNVRAVIEAFPLQAEEIVKKYGLNSDEFNQMLEETRGNPVFRWRVQRFRKKEEEESSASEKK